MNEEIACDSRREKHVDLHDAIQSLDNVTRSLDDLTERMQGPTPKNGGDETAKEPRPHLLDVLNGGSHAIREKAEEMHKRIERITELLF